MSDSKLTPDFTPGLALSLESSFFGFYAHAGFTAGLIENGVRPQFLTGASAGAMIAVLTGAGFSTEEIRSIIFSRKFKWAFWELKSFARGFAMMLAWPGVSGLTTFRDAKKYFTALLEDRAPNLEDCTHGEVTIPVANLNLMRTEILSTGDSAAAILASCAVPCLVAPQKLPSGYCWDGGLANSSPFLHYADDKRVGKIITHHIRHSGSKDLWTEPSYRPRISDTVSRAHHLIAAEIQRLHFQIMEISGTPIRSITSETPRPGLFSGNSLQSACYQVGYASAEKLLRDL